MVMTIVKLGNSQGIILDSTVMDLARLEVPPSSSG
jgi:antitoxin component of MazEF toxin-antitoxin module